MAACGVAGMPERVRLDEGVRGGLCSHVPLRYDAPIDRRWFTTKLGILSSVRLLSTALDELEEVSRRQL